MLVDELAKLRLSDFNGLNSCTQHKVIRSLGNNADSVHADGDNNQKKKTLSKFAKKRHPFDVIPAITFIAKNI